TTSGSGYSTIATNASLAFTNSSLNNGTRYYYVVRAVNASGESVDSHEVTARPPASAPTQLSLAVVDSQLQITWPGDHTGWRLQLQTKNLDVGLGTNWVNVPCSRETNQVMVPLNLGNGAVFFRMVRP